MLGRRAGRLVVIASLALGVAGPALAQSSPPTTGGVTTTTQGSTGGGGGATTTVPGPTTTTPGETTTTAPGVTTTTAPGGTTTTSEPDEVLGTSTTQTLDPGDEDPRAIVGGDDPAPTTKVLGVTLPRTGAGIAFTVSVALVLLAVGGVLVAATRRRRSVPPA